ncbi:MAG: hypothetical protein IJ545_01355 [Alphaproteobacteria bacterium]|nr:hypothetical protein [Alphaproteobacteria bacterium]
MKKVITVFSIIIILLMVIVFLVLLKQEKKDSISVRIEQETETYKKECFVKAFPKKLDNYSMYNDDIKEGDYRYHQCLKKIIIEKINQLANKSDADKMIQSLDKIQEGVSNFYWDLYNREDNGAIGRGVNDASLGRYYEQILKDIIHYQYVFSHDTI